MQQMTKADNIYHSFFVSANWLFISKGSLLITIANSLDPDQAQHNVGPDLDPNSLTLWSNPRKKSFLKKKSFDSEKKTTDKEKSGKKNPRGANS